MGTENETAIEKLARLREERAKRDEDQAKAAEAFELLELEKESDFAAQNLARDVDFAILRTNAGPIFLRSPALASYKRFSAKVSDPKAAATLYEDSFAFVREHLMHPTAEAFAPIALKNPGLVYRAAKVLHDLADGQEVTNKGK